MADLGESGTGGITDVKQTAAYRGLKAAVIILGVLIVAALVILVAGFAWKLGGHRQVREPTVAFSPPAGATLLSMDANGDRLVLHLRSATGDEVDILDTQDGRLVARLKFNRPAP